MMHKHSDQCEVKEHAFHEHPHEGDQEEIVKENSYDLAVDGYGITTSACLVDSNDK